MIFAWLVSVSAATRHRGGLWKHVYTEIERDRDIADSLFRSEKRAQVVSTAVQGEPACLWPMVLGIALVVLIAVNSNGSHAHGDTNQETHESDQKSDPLCVHAHTTQTRTSSQDPVPPKKTPKPFKVYRGSARLLLCLLFLCSVGWLLLGRSGSLFSPFAFCFHLCACGRHVLQKTYIDMWITHTVRVRLTTHTHEHAHTATVDA